MPDRDQMIASIGSAHGCDQEDPPEEVPLPDLGTRLWLLGQSDAPCYETTNDRAANLCLTHCLTYTMQAAIFSEVQNEYATISFSPEVAS